MAVSVWAVSACRSGVVSVTCGEGTDLDEVVGKDAAELKASAARTNDLDDGAERFSACSVGVEAGEHQLAMWLWRNVSTVDAHGLGRAETSAAVIPSPAQRGHGAVCVQHAGSITTPPPAGGLGRGGVRHAARSS
jgi:hypothetical protein